MPRPSPLVAWARSEGGARSTLPRGRIAVRSARRCASPPRSSGSAYGATVRPSRRSFSDHRRWYGPRMTVERRDERVVFVIEAGDFVGELGMLMGQRAFFAGVAAEGTELLRVRVEDLRRLIEISGELSDVLLAALDARRGYLTTTGEGGLVLAGDDDPDLHRLRDFAERNQLPYRTVLRSEPSAWRELARTCALPDAGTAVVTGERRVMTAPTTRELASALGIDP